MEPVKLPHIACPLLLASYPNAEKYSAGTVAWIDRWELYSDHQHRERLSNINCGQLATLMYPDCKSDALMQVMTDYVAWAFSFDDEYCDEGGMSEQPTASALAMQHMQRALESPEVIIDPTDRYALALRDIRQRIDTLASPLHGARFVTVQRGYFFVEINKLLHQVPDFNDCATLRLSSGGGLVFPVLAHIAAVNPISQSDLDSRRMWAMTEMAAMIVVWDSDIYSYGKELAREPDGRQHNICAWLHYHQHCSHDDAVVQAVDIRNRTFSLYLRLRADLLARMSPEIKQYIRGLDGYIRGGFEWIQDNRRYRYKNGVDGELAYVGGDIAEALPPLDEGTPIPVGSLAWWWEYDPAREAQR